MFALDDITRGIALEDITARIREFDFFYNIKCG
jgi:hypothetical protein